MTFAARHLSQTIRRDPVDVAAFAANPANLPLWAAGLSAGIRYDDGRWIAESPMGTVEVRFLGGTEFGVLDHDVVLPDGTVVHNPLRVLRNGRGSEVVFTLFALPGVTVEALEVDAELVRADLARLRDLLEAVAPA